MRCLNCHRQIEEGSICPDCRQRPAQPSDEQPNGISNRFMWFLLLSVTAFAILVIAKYQGQPELWMWTALIGVTLLLILLECIRRFIAHQKKRASEPPPKRTWQSPIYPYQTYELAEPRLADSGKYQCPQCHKHFEQWEDAKPESTAIDAILAKVSRQKFFGLIFRSGKGGKSVVKIVGKVTKIKFI